MPLSTHHSAPRHAAAAFPVSGRLTTYSAHDPQRAEVEQIIRTMYAQRYGALVPGFAPILMGLLEDGQVLAAAGYRRAGDGPLFLEHYLSAPVEAELSAAIEQPVQRERIAEVGHLAAPRGGEGRRLVQLLGPFLIGEGFDWVVGTVTQELQLMLTRLGLAPVLLGPALPEALGDQAPCWGSYYEHQPVVLAIHLRRSLRHFLAQRVRAAQRGEA